MSSVRVPDFGQVETVVIGIAVLVGGYILYSISKSIKDAGEVAGTYVEEKVAVIKKQLEEVPVIAQYTASFNPDDWRPAGYYVGDTCIFYTGGLEKKPGR